jgi:hypothetical protein
VNSTDLAILASLIKSLAETGAVAFLGWLLIPQLRVQAPAKKTQQPDSGKNSGEEGSR